MAQTSTWRNASVEEVALAYRKLSQWFINTTSYSFKLKYASFSSPGSSVEIESSEGYFIRSFESFVTEAVGLKTLQNKFIRLTIDSVDKTIMVQDPGNFKLNIATFDDLKKLLSNAKSIKKCRHVNGFQYKIDFYKNDQLDALEFLVDSRGILSKFTYFYSERVGYQKSRWDSEKETNSLSPRLEVTFSDYDMSTNISEDEFSERAVLEIEKGVVRLAKGYKDYRLIDYRLNYRK